MCIIYENLVVMAKLWCHLCRRFCTKKLLSSHIKQEIHGNVKYCFPYSRKTFVNNIIQQY